MHETSLDLARKLYPGITPRDDFDIIHLAYGQYTGPQTNEAVYEWVDKHLRAQSGTWPPGSTLEQGRAIWVANMKEQFDAIVQMTGVRARSLSHSDGLAYTCPAQTVFRST